MDLDWLDGTRDLSLYGFLDYFVETIVSGRRFQRVHRVQAGFRKALELNVGQSKIHCGFLRGHDLSCWVQKSSDERQLLRVALVPLYKGKSRDLHVNAGVQNG